MEMKTSNCWESENTGKYCVIRSPEAGVFVGKLIRSFTVGQCCTVILDDCIRIHYWSGAASLSQLAQEGVKNPASCRFSMPTNQHEIMNVIEIIPATAMGLKNIQEVPTWKK